MSVGKAAALTAALVGAMAIGVAIAPTVRDTWFDEPASTAATATAPKAETAAEKSTAAKSTAAKTERRVRRAAPVPTREPAMPRREADTLVSVPVGVWGPELRDRVKKVLNPGVKLELAAADFSNAEQFITVAHAARNTQVPFMVLKHRVLDEGRSLADAIHELKPELNAQTEVTRARDAAREDLEIAG
jgi:hypothetical protein